MNRPKAARRMVQWVIKLSQFDIEYLPRTAIKAQALVDFIAKFTFLDEDNPTNNAKQWTIQTDGSLAQKKGRVGVVVITNNEAEYEGILMGLRLRKALGVKNLLI